MSETALHAHSAFGCLPYRGAQAPKEAGQVAAGDNIPSRSNEAHFWPHGRRDSAGWHLEKRPLLALLILHGPRRSAAPHCGVVKHSVRSSHPQSGPSWTGGFSKRRESAFTLSSTGHYVASWRSRPEAAIALAVYSSGKHEPIHHGSSAKVTCHLFNHAAPTLAALCPPGLPPQLQRNFLQRR